MTNELIWQAEVSLLLSEKDINYKDNFFVGSMSIVGVALKQNN